MVMPRNLSLSMSLESFGFNSYDSFEEELDLVSPNDNDILEIEREEDEEDNENDFVFQSRKKKSIVRKKPHILDRTDSKLWGGFIRYQIYKKGKQQISFTDNKNCRCCNKEVVKDFNPNSVKQSFDLNKIYFKDKDSENRNLQEEVLALLQRFDVVGVCDCGELNFGFLPQPEKLSLKETIKQLSNVKPVQMTIFDM